MLSLLFFSSEINDRCVLKIAVILAGKSSTIVIVQL